ncbi:Drug transporter [Mycena sanguinolenta]|uniref:Drug transporter n=1 Tax=Mycena sanguinolenta TaxID=230812 RepID=A0A8H6Z666_9AGAR|nr:Drug transporter [Mycena sanguinolenta]
MVGTLPGNDSSSVFLNGLAVKSLQDINEPSLDPRASLSSRPDAEVLDITLAEQLGDLVRPHLPNAEKSLPFDGILYVDFEEGDIRNPACFPRPKKWAITLLACFSTLIASSAAAAYNLGFTSMTKDLNCTNFQATVGFIVYTLGFGLVPLVSSSFSEEFGRQPLYIGSAVGFTLMYLLIALSKNIQSVVIARFLQGSFGSTWATMYVYFFVLEPRPHTRYFTGYVNKTVHDTFFTLPRPLDASRVRANPVFIFLQLTAGVSRRGLPMAIFSVAALSGSGLGPLAAGWIEMNHRLQWRWIQWIQMIICGVYSLAVPFVMKETRSSILLMRLAKNLRKETGNPRYRAIIEDQRASLTSLIFISCTRPIHLLLTEPVVSAFSLWIGFLWGVMFSMIESIPGLFQDLHHFNVGQEGSVFASMAVGTVLGFVLNFYQEHLYHKHFDRRGPEARLISACAAAIMLPISMFIYAWCSFPYIPWISLVIAIAIYICATFIVYLSVFSYLADCYGPFASSALAGQSLCRNMMATIFPLFTKQMFAALGYNWANMMFALIAAVMVPIPFVLFFYGPAIRSRSRFSRIVMEQQQN